MANSNGDFNPLSNTLLPPELAQWPLDTYLDDDEFRAGYPFSDIPEMDSNDDWESHSSSPPPSDNDVFQSNSSGDAAYISTTKENEPLNNSLYEQKEKTISVLVDSRLMDEGNGSHETHTIQQSSYNEQDHNGHHQHGIENSVNDINIENFERSDHAEPSDYVVPN